MNRTQQRNRIQGQGRQQHNPPQPWPQFTGQNFAGQPFVNQFGGQLSRRQRKQLIASGMQGFNPYVPQAGYGGLPPQGFGVPWGGFQGQGQGFQGQGQGNVGGSRRSRRRGRRNLDLQGHVDTQYGDLGTTRGRYVGRGPKNFKRDDARLLDDVGNVLSRHPGIDASEIEVKVKDAEVILTGTVINRQMKLLAERLIDQIPGVQDIRNEIRVVRQDLSDTGTYTPTGATTGSRRGVETTQHARS